ncbi:hypothetical protein AMTR_s00051p00024210 [Amborella trichopoda]|uniref:Uncharacterized protein n=1 Tax=Amborella trichopoda TaxID=13333 RepID=U5D8B6_AMBTC|nr:hypothetical protein AMTR_s00051p00024210 [Amborella trichopoda]
MAPRPPLTRIHLTEGQAAISSHKWWPKIHPTLTNHREAGTSAARPAHAPQVGPKAACITHMHVVHICAYYLLRFQGTTLAPLTRSHPIHAYPFSHAPTLRLVAPST